MASSAVAARVARKEIGLFFASPVAWLFLAAFAAVTLFVFFWVESFFARNIADVRPLFQWLPLLLIFLSAALTMRMWSEERRSGTLEHVLTQPAGLWRFVLGKFRACFALLLLALAATLPLPITVALIADLDWGPVLAGYLASSLMGASYLSIGLFVSARTDNPIVSLMGTVALCSLLYLLGSPTLTDFFATRTGEILRLLGSGSRFDSITRGVLDARDLVYYLSLCAAFLALNVYSLEKQRWARGNGAARHRQWRSALVLLLANLVLANTWLARVDGLRLDLTEGRLYSLSPASLDLLEQLEEPLLIRAYFSAKTHPLLAPLQPQLRDLIEEYAVAGKGRVQVEFIDPAEHPELEKEANERFGIRATPFQVADRYQAALVNSYFNVLVQYGSEHQALGFSDLIEVRTAANASPEVLLRNPEYDITRAVRDVLYDYRAGGDLFQGIDKPVEFIAYVSREELLPDLLLAYKDAISAQLDDTVRHAGGKFSVRFIEPEAGDGTVAQQIEADWGFRPMVATLDDDQEFYFYLTLADDHQVVQLPTDDFDPTAFRLMLDSGLKRFARNFTKTVAVALPPAPPTLPGQPAPGPSFNHLEQLVTRDHSIVMENLADGSVSPEADILLVVAPRQLEAMAQFAIDQFLMRGGTVILATSPFSAGLEQGQIQMQQQDSGLAPWLAHHGIRVEPTLVLDEQHAAFPAPTLRQMGDYEFRDLKMVDYPWFVDLRKGGLNREHPITAGLPHLTMAWPSPLEVERNEGRRVVRLLASSPRSWRSDSLDVMPEQMPGAPGQQALAAEELGVVVQGRFESFFSRRPTPPTEVTDIPRAASTVETLLPHSPESARIILYASNNLFADRVLSALVTASGTQYLGPMELLANTLDWALQDGQLLEIRSRAHFNRTLPPMERQAQALIEYFNYGLAILWLLLLAAIHWLRKTLRKRRYARELAL